MRANSGARGMDMPKVLDTIICLVVMNVIIVLIKSIICLNLHCKEIIDCTKKPFLHRDQQGRKYSK